MQSPACATAPKPAATPPLGEPLLDAGAIAAFLGVVELSQAPYDDAFMQNVATRSSAEGRGSAVT